jgi:arylsulfatase A-like enzyme/predicted Zn-dependent protease
MSRTPGSRTDGSKRSRDARPRPDSDAATRAPRYSRRVIALLGAAIAVTVAAIALVAALRGFHGSPGRSGLGELPRGLSPADLNLIVITLDTTRADRIGCYGSKSVETPVLDALASRGVLFEAAVSPTPLTLPAHCSLFTGELPSVHGVRDNGGFRLGADRVTLAEVLRDHGWKTGGFVSAYVLDHRWGIAQGFDRYFDDFDLSKQKSVSMGDIQRRGDETIARSVEWIGKQAGGKFFAWVHLYDPHAPYDPPEPYASRYSDRPYDGEIAWTDQLVGRLLDGVEKLGLTDRTIIAVLADHGESLGEHGEHGHGFFIYEQVTRVPFLLVSPYSGLRGRRVSDVVRNIDVAPTLLDLLGRPGVLQAQGRSLLPLLGGKGPGAERGSDDSPQEPSRTRAPDEEHQSAADSAVGRSTPTGSNPASGAPSGAGRTAGLGPTPASVSGGPSELTGAIAGYSESFYPRFHFDWSELRGVRTRKWHFIEAPRPELYDVESDPGELNNVVGREPQVLEELRGVLASIDRQSGPAGRASTPVEDDEETLRKLAALGYIGGAASHDTSASFRDLPDPKDRLAVYQLMNRAREEVQAEREDAALGLLTEVIASDPKVVDAWYMMGNLYFKKHDWAQAAEHYRRALAMRPDHDYAMIGLADTLVATGRIDDAVVGYRRFLEKDPGNAQISYRLAQVMLDDGRTDDAAAQFRRTLEIEPKTASAEVGLAVAASRKSDLPEARRAIDRALAIDPAARHARFNLALVLEAEGDPAGAVREYRAEVEAWPGAYKAWFNLGRLLGKMGQPQDGIAALRRCVEIDPTFAVGHFFLAQALFASGDSAGAAFEARAGLKAAPDSEFAPLGHYVLADVYGKEGRAADSEAEARIGRDLEEHRRVRSRERSADPGAGD